MAKSNNFVSVIRPDLLKYFVNKHDADLYTIGSHKKVELKCPICNHIRFMNVYDLCTYGFYCPICSDNISLPNKICRYLISNLPVDNYTFEYVTKWSQGKQYDGYFKFDNKDYLLEFDGAQHFYDSQWTTKDQQQKIDKIKDNLAKENNHLLIRIDCRKSNFEYIMNKIKCSYLAELFDLSKIDWNKCREYTLKNINFEIVEYYNNNPDKTISELCSDLHMGYQKVTDTLKKFSEMGFCNFSKEHIKENQYRKARETRGENFEEFYVYNDSNIKIGEFKYHKDCVKFFKENFQNIKISTCIIYHKLYTGNSYNGFTFVYKDGLKKHHENNQLLFDVCDYYNNHIGITQQELGKVFNISPTHACRNIEAGHNLGICDINNAHWIINRRSKNFVTLLKDGKIIDKFNTIKECANKICELLNNSVSVYTVNNILFQNKRKGCNSFNYKGFYIKIKSDKEAIWA